MTQHPSILPLKIENLDYEAGGKQLIKNINCEFNQGKRYLLLGPNGAGKTLLLRLCHGLLKPKSGKVIWSSGKDANPKHHQAMVTQRPVMLRRSAYANIDYALSVRGVEKSLRPDMINAVIQRTGLTRVANKLATVLSLGEQQRLAIARAWVLKPEVLFMDEPTGGLDVSVQAKLLDLLRGLVQNLGLSVVIVTHDLAVARLLSHRLMVMKNGHVVESGLTDQVLDDPQDPYTQLLVSSILQS